MKKLIVLILCLCMSLSFVGCIETNAEVEDLSDRIKRVYVDVKTGENFLKSTSENLIFVDSKTGVMYLCLKVFNGGGLTVMLDENGDPLLWEDSEVTK